MKQLASMAWKEWHEVRAFLWIALALFIGLPIVGGLEAILQYSRRFEISTTPWVIAFGGVLAIFVAVGATCRDFSGHLEDFWRSRPVGVTRWLLVKYFVGLAVVLAACLLPLVVEFAVDRDKNAVVLVAWFPFLWIVLYSIGFLAGCLVRRAAHAAMLGLAGMLLVYFLPVVLPPLQWLNAATVVENSGEMITAGSLEGWVDYWGPGALQFAAGMLGIAIIVLALALIAIRFGWRVDSGRKMMYGSVSAAILILVSSAAFQLGTNLPILQQTGLPSGEDTSLIHCDGTHGFIVTQQFLMANPFDSGTWTRQFYYHSLELASSGIKLGNTIKLGQDIGTVDFMAAWNPQYPTVRYNLNGTNLNVRHNVDGRVEVSWALEVAQLDTNTFRDGPLLWASESDRPVIYARENRLYVIGTRLVTLDISQPMTPRIISDIPFPHFFGGGFEASGMQVIVLNLPPIPGFSSRQRIEIALKRDWMPVCFEGDTLCTLTRDRGTLCAYRLTKLTDTTATFKLIGLYQETLLDRMFGSFSYYNGMKLQNGLLYMGGEGHGWVNPHVSVFDTRGQRPLPLIGHFAAPGAGTVCPLPDGRAIVGGSQLWLVGPPPHRGGE